jgi:hypothetical protein
MISVTEIVELHQSAVSRWHRSGLDIPYPSTSFLTAVCQQHQFNYLLWHEEDRARSPEASDTEIARVKRAIDGYNQKRNDWIEKIDDQIADMLARNQIAPHDSASLNTETPGSAIDRLSILSLRLYHLEEQLVRTDVDEQHLRGVQNKVAICRLQQQELATSLGELFDDLWSGRKRHRTYRQLKMYNDPALNPYLYRGGQPSESKANG